MTGRERNFHEMRVMVRLMGLVMLLSIVILNVCIVKRWLRVRIPTIFRKSEGEHPFDQKFDFEERGYFGTQKKKPQKKTSSELRRS